MSKILIIEDDEATCTVVRDWLELERHCVESAATGEDGWYLLKNYRYDVAIVDWELPDVSGVEIVRRLRAAGQSLPVLMLTGKSSLDEKEAGLDSGADDYLTKPFATRELSARIRALLRRPASCAGNVLTCGNVELDTVKARVTCGDQSVKLLPGEYALLEFLMRHQGKVFSVEALLNNVWPSDSEATISAVRTNITRLRGKLGPGNGLRIATLHGLGYVLEAET